MITTLLFTFLNVSAIQTEIVDIQTDFDPNNANGLRNGVAANFSVDHEAYLYHPLDQE